MNGLNFAILIISIGSVLVVALPAWMKQKRTETTQRIDPLEEHLDNMLSYAIENHWDEKIGFDILQSRDERPSKDEGASYDLKRTVILRNQNQAYALGIFYNDQSKYLLQTIDEIRARRALFLWPEDYLKAFGEMPHRNQIHDLQKNLQSKLNRYDSAKQHGEIFSGSPLGQEFGANKS
jgi:hypothetical protein